MGRRGPGVDEKHPDAAGRATPEAAAAAAEPIEHPEEADLGFLYGVIFVGPARAEGVHSRNVCVFADGEVDRSPCGSGTSARLAILDSLAELRRGEELIHDSIIGSTFTGRVTADTNVAGIHAVATNVRGAAFKTGESRFFLDSGDPIGLGFQLR